MVPQSQNTLKSTSLRAAISFVVIAVVSFIAIKTSSNEIEKNLMASYSRNQGIIADLVAIRIQDFFTDIRKELQNYGERPGIRYIDKSTLRGDIIDLSKALETKASNISRMDTLGLLKYSWPDTSAIGQSVAYQSHVRKTLAGHCEVISQPILTVQGYRAIAIHQPIFENGTKWLGNICALVPFEAIETRLLSELDKIGSEGFIVDSTGEILYHPDLATGTLVERAFPRDSSGVLNSFLKSLPEEFSGSGIFVDHTGAKRPMGIATIELGDYHWYIATYNSTDELKGLIGGIRRKAFLAYIFILASVIGAYFYYGHFGVGRLIREWQKTNHSTSKGRDRLIELISGSLRVSNTRDNEREVLQILVNNLLEAGGLNFAGLFRRRDSMDFSLVAQAYLDEDKFQIFLEFSDIDPFSVKVTPDPRHPIVRSLAGGEAVKFVSNEQVASLSKTIVDMGVALDKTLPRNDKYILPVRVKGELLGSIILCVEQGKILSLETLEPFIDQIGNELQKSELERKLRNTSELYWDVFQSIDSAALIIDSSFNLLSFNKLAGDRFGLTLGMTGKRAIDSLKPAGLFDNEDNFTEVMKNSRPFEIEETVFDKRREAKYYRKRLVPVFSSAGAVRRIIVIIEDISQEKELVERLSEANRKLDKTATTDELTGLCNHHYFMERLHLTMEAAREAKAPLSLIIFDLQDLKGLNDRWGRRIGDEVLKNVARIISERISTVDIAARFGGDEFAVLLRNTSHESALARAELIRANIADKAVDRNAPIDSVVTASFGIVELDDSIQSTDEFFRRTERALYRAKTESGRRPRD